MSRSEWPVANDKRVQSGTYDRRWRLEAAGEFCRSRSQREFTLLGACTTVKIPAASLRDAATLQPELCQQASLRAFTARDCRQVAIICN